MATHHPGPASRARGTASGSPRKSDKRTKAPLSATAMGKHLRQHGSAIPQPPARWRQEQLPLLLAKWDAFGGFIGRRNRAGKWLDEPCLTVMTTDKRDPKRGDAMRVPAFVRWKDGRHTYRLATDVLQVTPSVHRHLANVLGPGDGVTVGEVGGSIGAAVLHPQSGRCVLTAGHVVANGGGARGLAATVTSNGTDFPASIADYSSQTTIDYAVIQPLSDADCDNLFRDVYRIGPVYTPTAADVGTTVFLLDGAGSVTRTWCRGVQCQFDTAKGTYFDIVQTDCISSSGQSGGALIDSAQRIWGFLIGALDNKFSIFAPAQLIFDAAGVQLIQG